MIGVAWGGIARTPAAPAGLPATAWIALAAAVLVTALPGRPIARAGVLAAAGRLATRSRSPARRLRPAAGTTARAALPAAAAAGGVAGMLAGGPPLAAGAAAVASVAAVLARDAVTRHRDAARRRSLLAAVRVLVAELEAGAAPARALASAAGTAPAWAVLGDAARAASTGGDAGAVLDAGQEPHVRALGLAWRLGESAGAALAEVLGRVAGDLGDAEEQRRVVAVALAGPRSSAVLLSALPLLGLGLGAAMGARPLAFLTAGDGRLVAAAGLILVALGLTWIRRILRRAER